MVYTLLADGFEEIEALAVVDILRRADINTQTVSITNCNSVCGAHGIEINTDTKISEIGDYDIIFLPGGYPGYVNLKNSPEVNDLLEKAYNTGKIIVAICAAPSILGEKGFLKGKTACCFPSFEDKLIGASVSYEDVVISERIITSRGAGTAHKLGFKLVEIIKGKEEADKLQDTMLYK